MKRLYAGTDIAMIGAWDSNSNQNLPSETAASKIDEIIEKASSERSLFYINTGADGGGYIHIYVNEDVPENIKSFSKVIEENFSISIPSGELIVGGIEEYIDPSLVGEADNSLRVPEGDYSLKCHMCDDEDESRDDDAEKSLREIVGERELAFYDNVNLYGCLIGGGLSVMALVIALFIVKWYFALSLPVLAALVYFHLMDWGIRRSERYKKLDDIIPQFRLEHEHPTFVFELTQIFDV